jgi:DNA polymerase III delta subunit
MYVVFFGTDRRGVHDAMAAYSDLHVSADATVTTIDAADYQSGQVADALGATSLFGGAQWFILDTPSNNADFNDEVHATLGELASSSNTFLILEGPLLAVPKKAYGKHATEMTERTAEKIERFNSFALAEALATKDKRRLWVLLQEARLNGSRDEEIIGMLWWQLKALRLAKNTTSAEEAGMKEFPYSKAKRALAVFAPGEVERLAQDLLALYHDGHAGVREMDVALEQWVLQV